MTGLLARSPRLRVALPWILWSLAVVVVIPLAIGSSGFGTAPAIAEVRQVNLSSTRTLPVDKVHVRHGDAVVAGQVVVELGTGELDLELSEAEAEARRLELDIESRGMSVRDNRSEAANRLASEAERAALDVSQLAADLERDRSELAQIDEQIAREQKLVAEGLAKADNLNNLKLRRAALGKKVEGSDAALKQARRNASATARRFDGLRGQADGSASATTATVEPARAAIAAQRERIRQLGLMREQLKIRAPFAGRVGAVLASAGEVVAAGAPIVTIAESHPRTAVAYVDQRWSSRLQVGDRATLVPSDGIGAVLHGRVEALGATLGELPVRFRLIPTEPHYGREVFIRLDEAAPLPGQAFNATFARGGS